MKKFINKKFVHWGLIKQYFVQILDFYQKIHKLFYYSLSLFSERSNCIYRIVKSERLMCFKFSSPSAQNKFWYTVQTSSTQKIGAE